MVLKKYIRALSGTILFLTLLFFFSCEEMKPLFIDCTECYNDEPDQAQIELDLDGRNLESTTIKIYEGNLEENLLFKTLITNNSSTIATVKLNIMYTVTATYHIDECYYTAVSTVTPHVKYDVEHCGVPCYYIYDKVVNLKLKYLK